MIGRCWNPLKRLLRVGPLIAGFFPVIVASPSLSATQKAISVQYRTDRIAVCNLNYRRWKYKLARVKPIQILKDGRPFVGARAYRGKESILLICLPRQSGSRLFEYVIYSPRLKELFYPNDYFILSPNYAYNEFDPIQNSVALHAGKVGPREVNFVIGMNSIDFTDVFSHAHNRISVRW